MSAHGTERRYRLGCRCDECRAANTARCLAYQRRRGRRPIEEYRAERSQKVRHGTAVKYQDHGCRCADCREWARTRRARSRAVQRSRPIPEHVHGTLNGYQNYGCRCDPCRAAMSADRQKRRAS